MIFDREEQLVEAKFREHFAKEVPVLEALITLYQDALMTTKSEPDEYANYAALTLGGLKLKTLVSAYDRLRKGYLGDCESLIKRFIEAQLAEQYLFHHPEDAKEWCQGKKNLGAFGGRRQMAQALDRLNTEGSYFPTDARDFFEHYIYESGYQNSNIVAHLDFELAYKEATEGGNDEELATTMVAGPKWDEEYMRTLLKRLLFFGMVQTTFVATTLNGNEDIVKRHDALVAKVKDGILPL